jgi:dihydrofolate synthase/folylpolyglutamate synthase
MTYPESLKYLESLGHELHGRKFGLEAINLILEKLGRPHERYETVIVAGTNGKGSTSAILASILQQSGYRTGLFTSPHLVRVNERMRVEGKDVSDDDFAAALGETAAAVEGLIQGKELEAPPSYFEFIAAVAFQHFARAGAEMVVLEVGMGGRLDATNVTNPRVSVITSIDFDHIDFLGSTLAKIAAEKAGVIRPHRPVVSAVENDEAQEVIRFHAKRCGAELHDLRQEARIRNLKSMEGRYTFDLELGGERFARLPCPLAGEFQVRNTVAAVAAAWQLHRERFTVSRRSIVQGLRATVWPGRLEAIASHPLVLLDGAHNPAAARELANFIQTEVKGRTLRLVYGSMRDKAVKEITASLFPLASEIYLTHPDHPRAAPPEEILASAGPPAARLLTVPDPVQALEAAVRASSAEDVVVVTGSLYLVGEIKKAQVEGGLRLSTPAKEPLE